MERLTDERFWDEYWSHVVVPTTIDLRVPFERALSGFLRRVLEGRSGTALEIGCAPGKWLAFVAEERGLRPAGIEYSQAGISATRRNFEAHAIEPEALIVGDFFDITPEPRYDVVMSFGFIEHFDDPVPVVRRHVDWLKPGGLLVIGVPNFTGIHGALQRVLGPETYAAHNLEVMRPEWARACAAQLGLELAEVSWMAGFEPALPVVEAGRRGLGVVGARIALGIGRRLRRSPLLDGVNGPRVSAYLAWAAQKPGDPS